jgi:hypothetical protein
MGRMKIKNYFYFVKVTINIGDGQYYLGVPQATHPGLHFYEFSKKGYYYGYK